MRGSKLIGGILCCGGLVMVVMAATVVAQCCGGGWSPVCEAPATTNATASASAVATNGVPAATNRPPVAPAAPVK